MEPLLSSGLLSTLYAGAQTTRQETERENELRSIADRIDADKEVSNYVMSTLQAKTGEGPANAAVASFIQNLYERKFTDDQVAELLHRVKEEYDFGGPEAMVSNRVKKTVSDYMREVADSHPDASVGKLRLQMEGYASEKFEGLANAFDLLGEKGREVANAFELLHAKTKSFEEAQKLLAIQVPYIKKTQVGYVMNEEKTPIYNEEKVTGGILDIVNQNWKDNPITDKEILEGFYDDLVAQVSAIFGKNIADLTREEVVQGLRGLYKTPMVVPNMTNLDSALEEAADAIRHGLLEPVEYSGEKIKGIANEFEQFNRTIFKVHIVEELERLSKYFVAGGLDFSSQMGQLLGELGLAGENAADVFTDPLKFAEFMAKAKYDVSVDNSTNNNFVVRISGDTNLEGMTKAADEFMKEVNRLSREQRK